MLKSSEHDLLQAIFNEMQELKKAVQIKDERRVSIHKFVSWLNVTTVTLYKQMRKSMI